MHEALREVGIVTPRGKHFEEIWTFNTRSCRFRSRLLRNDAAAQAAGEALGSGIGAIPDAARHIASLAGAAERLSYF